MQISRTALTEILAAMCVAENFRALRDAVIRAAMLLGTDRVYFVAPLVRDARTGRVLVEAGLPKVWVRHYRSALHQIDPILQHAINVSAAFIWPRDIDYEELTDQQRRFMKIAARYGLESGIGVACYGPQGRAGFLGMTWSQDTPASDEMLLAVHQVGQVSFQRYCQIVKENFKLTPLSNRELEVLSWMCGGKSNPAMAKIIGVSRSSIDAYIRRIFAKFQVTDRTAACMRAYSLGIVASDEVKNMVELARKRDEEGS